VRYADIVLGKLGPDDRVFAFEYRQAHQFLAAAVRRSGATTQPMDAPVRWKDLRSGMASHLLRNGWSRDEVNARLGHAPHSAVLDAYINFLALDRDKPKQRMTQGVVDSLQSQLQDAKRSAQLASERLGREESQNHRLASELQRTRDDIDSLRRQMEKLVAAMGAERTG
jgi:hypothetical protein